MGRRWWNKKDADFDSDLLNEAFKRFRKAGLIARQNYMCCGGCAGAAMASDLGDKVKKVWDERGPVMAKAVYTKMQRKIKGVAFYHRQDRDHLEESGGFHLRYGSVEASNVGSFGLPTVEIGKMIVAILTELNITHEWDGTEHQCIYIDVRTKYQKDLDDRREKEAAERQARYDAEKLQREREELEMQQLGSGAVSIGTLLPEVQS